MNLGRINRLYKPTKQNSMLTFYHRGVIKSNANKNMVEYINNRHIRDLVKGRVIDPPPTLKK